jgi:hypothetical protein
MDKVAGCEANHSPHLVPRLRMSGAIPPLHHIPLRHEQGLLYLYPLLCITEHHMAVP